MQEAKQRWRALCERAVNEADPQRFAAAIEELLQQLDSDERQVKAVELPPSKRPPEPSG